VAGAGDAPRAGTEGADGWAGGAAGANAGGGAGAEAGAVTGAEVGGVADAGGVVDLPLAPFVINGGFVTAFEEGSLVNSGLLAVGCDDVASPPVELGDPTCVAARPFRVVGALAAGVLAVRTAGGGATATGEVAT
jgi:hypothetical protein